MLNDILKQYQTLKVPIPDWLEKYDNQSKQKHVGRKKKQFLVRSLIDLLNRKNIQWIVSESSKLALVLVPPNLIIVLQENSKSSSRWSGGVVYTHTLTILEDNKEILAVTEWHENHDYDEIAALLGSLPIVDLYDLATKKERRKGRLAHVCGLAGFGAPGDTCSACEGKRSWPRKDKELPY